MQHITPKALQGKLAENSEIYLLDVREIYEHADNNIGGKLIPLGEIISKADTIPKDRPVVVYCHRGIRSQIAIQRLEEKFAFTNLINLSGGLIAWEREFGQL